MYNIAEIDNSADIISAINNTLPKMKQEKLRDKYNATIELIKSTSYTSLDKNKLLLCDSVILRCVDTLHLGDTHIIDNYKIISKSTIRNTTYNKETVLTSCRIVRRKTRNETITYSPEEKLMLYILVSTYLKRVGNKKMMLSNNLTYIDLKDIHLLFGNNAELKTVQKDKYISIINQFINDNIEIYIGNDKYDDGNAERFTSWFSYIKEISDYNGNVIGYVYSFGDLGRRFSSSTNYPTRYISYDRLSINNRNYKQFEITRYLIYNATDRRKKLGIRTIMNELFDYNQDKSYIEVLYSLTNPSNIKYLKSFLNSITKVVNNISEQFNFILYYDNKVIDNSSNIDLYANMKEFDKLYLKISYRMK